MIRALKTRKQIKMVIKKRRKQNQREVEIL